MFKYIIKADYRIGIAVHSDLNYNEFKDYIRMISVRDHNNTCITVGTNVYYNPVVMLPNDFADFCPYLIGIK